jgi:hypothetical protein
MSEHAEQGAMTDEKPAEQRRAPVSHIPEDEPDPTVKPPALAWISKSYKPGKPTADGMARAEDE